MVGVRELAAPAVVREPERLHVAQVGHCLRLGSGPGQFENRNALCRGVDASHLRGGPGTERLGVHRDDVADGNGPRWLVSSHARMLAGCVRGTVSLVSAVSDIDPQSRAAFEPSGRRASSLQSGYRWRFCMPLLEARDRSARRAREGAVNTPSAFAHGVVPWPYARRPSGSSPSKTQPCAKAPPSFPLSARTRPDPESCG